MFEKENVAFRLHVFVSACATRGLCNINAETWDAAPLSLRSPTKKACVCTLRGSTVVSAPHEIDDGLSVKWSSSENDVFLT